MNLIRLNILQVLSDKNNSSLAIIFFETEQQMPVRFGTRIGIAEGNYILELLNGQNTNRTSGVFVFIQLCKQLEIKINNIVISRFENQIYECDILCDDENLSLKCRISDAVIIALYFKVNLLIPEDILSKLA